MWCNRTNKKMLKIIYIYIIKMSKTRKLPKLRKIVNKDRKHTYKLKDPQKKRILAINEKFFF